MDQALQDILESAAVRKGEAASARYRFLDHAQGIVEIDTPSGPVQYTLKPIRELYGPGRPEGPVSPQDKHYEPLFMAIEQEIAAYDHEVPRLTDSLVQLTLETMNRDPAGTCQDDLCRRLQAQLRFVLSISDYSRREVKTALGTIARSVERHKVVEGRRGYLEFVHEFFG